MNLQTYQAKTMAEALARVKRELGRDAVILHTRTVRRGGLWGIGGHTMVEVTASRDLEVLPPRAARDKIERPTGGARRPLAEPTAVQVAAAPTSPAAPATPDPELRRELHHLRGLVQEVLNESRRGRAPAAPEAIRDEYLRLIEAEVAEEIARDMMDEIRARPGDTADPDRLRTRLREMIAAMVPAAGPIVPRREDRPRVVALVGPTGVGKTTTIAKLAAHFRLRENRRVGLITIDTYRIAAVDQLRVYAGIIGIPLEVVMTPADMEPALRRLHECDVVLIDTAGRGQNDGRRLEELKQFLAAARPDEVHLVLACNASQSVLLSAARQFEPVGVDRIVFTKLDEAVGFGVLLNVLRRVDKKLSYLTTGQDVPDDIEVGHGRRVAELILGSAPAARAAVGLRG